VTVIGITNSEDGPLAREAQISIVVPIEMDRRFPIATGWKFINCHPTHLS
jgi:DNA-binding MurR/RpiR family transcriptional regulator